MSGGELQITETRKLTPETDIFWQHAVRKIWVRA
jgi:hypothetical protein